MEPKLCPFCKSDDLEVQKGYRSSWVYCTGCGAYGPIGNDDDGAAEAWNRRAWEGNDA